MIMKTARSVSLELCDGGIYYTQEKYRIEIPGREALATDTVITSLYGLKPDTEYDIKVKNEQGEVLGRIRFRTDYEFVTLNVRDFGAKGDGNADDTAFIQAAVMACPKDGRVLIPAGRYKVTSVFLKSDLNLELAEGAELLADTCREHFAILPGLTESYDETDEYPLGTWEGNPLPMFAGIFTGIDVSHVRLYGKGSVNGCANHENWWKNEKVMAGAFRPRLLFLIRCTDVQVQGIYFHDSPAWAVHPYFCRQLVFCDLFIENPKNSPNTDGLDPESCRDTEICGIRFSLGDDCVAIKSGKIYMGRKYKTPSMGIHVYQCLMQYGHGAVTVGSEMAGGIRDILVEKCLFYHTDRGLRIKTRRGRGKDAVIDNIVFRDLKMEQVMTPFTANAFYFCDPDGRTEFVQSRETYPVDEGTPCIRRLLFENITAVDCHVAASWFEGLPEKKIEQITMRNVSITFAEEARTDVPIMSEGVNPCSRKGIYARNVKTMTLDNVTLAGNAGPKTEFHDVDAVCEAQTERTRERRK